MIKFLEYELLLSHNNLVSYIYSDMNSNLYWSDDFSPQYYIDQAKAGFIATTTGDGTVLVPEMQFEYAVLFFENLHINKSVAKLIKSKGLSISLDNNIKEICHFIDNAFENNWLSDEYCNTLIATNNVDNNFEVVTVYIRENGKIVAGEIGYIIGKTYTSLSGFVVDKENFKNYGTAQMVLLAQYLQKNGFEFWNMGHPYMDYKFKLGAIIMDRLDFLNIWLDAI